MNPALKASNPKLAERVAALAAFARNYDLSDSSNAATFVEGIRELGNHVSMCSLNATLQVDQGADGIVGFTVVCTPQPTT